MQVTKLTSACILVKKSKLIYQNARVVSCTSLYQSRWYFDIKSLINNTQHVFHWNVLKTTDIINMYYSKCTTVYTDIPKYLSFCIWKAWTILVLKMRTLSLLRLRFLCWTITICQRQPNEDARLARRRHFRALQKYRAGGKNLEWSRDMFVR